MKTGNPEKNDGEPPFVVNVHLTAPLMNEHGDTVGTLAFPQPTFKRACAFATDAAKQPVAMHISPEVVLIVPLHRIDHIVVRPLLMAEDMEGAEAAGPHPEPPPKIEVVRN